MKYLIYILTLVISLALISCGKQAQGTNIHYGMKAKSEIINDLELSSSSISLVSNEIEEHKGYFEIGYDDGYEDGDHLEKGRSYKKNVPEEWKSEYRQGYFAGYADGRAAADPSDDYFTGNNNTDYFDLSDDVYEGYDEDWSDEEDL